MYIIYYLQNEIDYSTFNQQEFDYYYDYTFV